MARTSSGGGTNELFGKEREISGWLPRRRSKGGGGSVLDREGKGDGGGDGWLDGRRLHVRSSSSVGLSGASFTKARWDFRPSTQRMPKILIVFLSQRCTIVCIGFCSYNITLVKVGFWRRIWLFEPRGQRNGLEIGVGWLVGRIRIKPQKPNRAFGGCEQI